MKLPAKLNKPRLLAILLVAACVTSLLGRRFAGRLRQGVSPALAPVSDGAMYLATLIRTQLHDLAADELSGAEAEALRQKNREYRGRIVALEADLQRRLRRQQDMDDLMGRELMGFGCQLMPARVIGVESLPYGGTRTVNVGTSNGVAAGAAVTTRRLLTDRSKKLPLDLAVLSRAALVGKLTATGPFTARLQLVTDAGFIRVARVDRIINPRAPRQITVYTSSGGVVRTLTEDLNGRIRIEIQIRGDGQGGMVAEQVKAHHNVRPGDWVVTSENDPFLPTGVRIGTVRDVRKSKHPNFVSLAIEPHANLDTLREVYIVYPVAGRLQGGRRGRAGG